MTFVVVCGGEVDTIGAMAGANWGTVNGVSSLRTGMVEQLEQSVRVRQVGRILLQCSARANEIGVYKLELSLESD